MIVDFSDAETQRLWETRRSRRLPGMVQARALSKLEQLHHAGALDDLRVPPGNRLEALSGDRAGSHSIRINQQWRICFTWTANGPAQVAIVDYH
jgi:proteic killer suppression protein